jgi:anti-sigma B factor antagonist
VEINSEGVDPVVISVEGEVDLATSPRLAQALDSALGADATTTIRVDLSKVEFMDSAGLRVLVAARRRAEEAGVGLVLHEPHDRVRRIIEITGLTGVFGLA